MTTGILTVTKVVDGQEWANTYGISFGSTPGPLAQEDLAAIIATNPSEGFDASNTNASAGSYVGGSSIIGAILGFERAMHYSAVGFVRLNLNDGSTPGTPTGEFWSSSISFTGIKDVGAGVPIANIAPLNVALLMNRSGAGLSVKPGRLYYRGVLTEAQIRPGSRVGVTWQDPAAQAQLNSDAENALTVTLLPQWYDADSLTGVHLTIVQQSRELGSEGVIIDGRPVGSITVNKPVSRQLTRGRRRRP